MYSKRYNAIIIGAGIIGLTLAWSLRQAFPKWRILILEKEVGVGFHGSGRNSGVVHSGIYYPEGSLKAKVCGEGARLMRAYCERHDLPYDRIGKIIIPYEQTQSDQLALLYHRAQANGVNVQRLCREELEQFAPDVRSATGEALFVPETAIVSPNAVLNQLICDLENQGVDILYGHPVQDLTDQNRSVLSQGRTFHCDLLLNAAGLFADSIAHMAGLPNRYQMLPFKGIYYKLRDNHGFSLQHLIYPVPDLRVPFLGVHFTPSLDGNMYVGPTAVPAFGRENYHGCSGIQPLEAARIAWDLTQQYFQNQQGFRAYAHQEADRLLKFRFLNAAKRLLPGLKSADLLPCDKVGIRAQLVDQQTGQLVMDFLVEASPNAIHILNAVSPGFTSAFAFAKWLVNNYLHAERPVDFSVG